MEKDTYNRGGLIAFVFSFVFSLLFFVYISWMYPGIDLKEIPEAASPTQTLAGEGAAKAVDVSKVEKPWETNPDMVAHGAVVYSNTCAVCHGAKGLGDGVGGASLNPKPRDLVEGKWKVGGSSIQLFGTLQNGIPGTSMAPFGHLPVVDRWALVQFIHSITQNKVQDDPAKLAEFAKTAK